MDYLNALLKKPVARTPVWIMRQAGRYLPEYQKTRQQAGDFLTLCKTPELACEVTLQPLRRFDLDAAIVFSDILTVPDAMGMRLAFVEGEGPVFEKPLTSLADINNLQSVDVNQSLDYVMDTVALIKSHLQHVPLIGFSGSPWTLATYMIEGRGSKQFIKAKKLLMQQPQALHLLLEKLTDVVSDYLLGQANAGADSLMIFDTWGGILSHSDYQTYSLAYMTKIIKKLKEKQASIPVTLFTKGGGQWLEIIANSGCDAIGLDWTTPLDYAKKLVGKQVSLQGNLDPAVLYASDKVIRCQVEDAIKQMGVDTGYVFNLGHGINPDVKPEKLAVLIDAVHNSHH